ncbi:cytochrome P450 [Cubamyces menziesii]|nr:cytochrome P450 [Cubamyces menziesii]
MFDIAAVLWTLAALLLVSIVKWCFSPIHAIPTVGGSSLPILSYFAGRRFRQNARELLQEGYKKYYGSVFKVAMTDQWIYVASGPKMIEEIRSWRDDELSLSEALSQNFQMKVIMGSKVVTHSYHIGLVKNELTDNIKEILPDLIDELSLAVPEYIPTKGSEWTKVNVLATMRTLLARISNRVFVGAPACRNKEYLGYATSYTTKLIKDVKFFRTIPWIPKPIAAWLFSDARKTLRKGVSILKPMIDERKAMMAKWGDDWQDKPASLRLVEGNDFLRWILDIAVPEKETDLEIAVRLMNTNLASILSTAITMTNAFFLLAQNPEYIGPLRTEIQSVIEEGGWTKASFGRMSKVDSLLKETLRGWNIGISTMRRRTLKDIKLHDGTVIPRDTLIMAATSATHTDGAVYEDADRFDPFRFARMREAEGDATKHQFVHTSANYLSFGHGRHACPGRFFVANEMKALLSYVLLNYDFKMSDDWPWTPNYKGLGLIPPLGSLLFKNAKTRCIMRWLRGGN